MRRTRGIHARGVSAKQRFHLAALLIAFLAVPAFAGDIEFDPAITREEFQTFSRLMGQSIYATPIDSARARGLLGFDVGAGLVAVPVDPDQPFWQHSVADDFTVADYLVVPRVMVSKGLSVATLSAVYSKIPSTDVAMWGAAVDVPILNGGVVTPTLALRGAYSKLTGTADYDLKTYGAEVFLSKGFGPVTPYGGIGIARSDAEGRVYTAIEALNPLVLTDESTNTRYTLGVKLSMLLPKIIVEATHGEETSYAAKVAFGF